MTGTAAPPVPASGGRRVEPVVAPPPGNPRFPLIDSLRALAALSVLVYHTAYATTASHTAWYGTIVGHLNVGVPLFFAISGFLLYRPFFAARYLGRAAPRPRDFWRRRVLRIIPAYWLALTVLAIYPGLPGVFTDKWWAYYGLLQIYDGYTIFGGLPQAWSLCVEAAFYLVLPLYALAMTRVSRGRSRAGMVRIELAVLASLGLASLVWRTANVEGLSTIHHSTLLALFDWFAPGMALAVLSVVLQAGGSWRPAALLARRPELAWGLALLLYAVLALSVEPKPIGALQPTAVESLALNVLAVAAAALVLVPAVFGAENGGPIRRLLAWRTLAWLGMVSYGIFLWHHTLMQHMVENGVTEWVPGSGFIVVTTLTVIGATALAAASYYGLERPILRLKDRRRARRSD